MLVVYYVPSWYNLITVKKKERFNLLFCSARIAKNITQSELAQIAVINRSSIAQFEKSIASLSIQTLLKIAPALDINPDFLLEKSDNPFKSKNLIKFFITGTSMPDRTILILTILYNTTLELITLIPPLSIIEKIKTLPTFRTVAAVFDTHTLFGKMIYAVAVRDVDNNIFLFRRKKENDFIIWGDTDLQSNVSTLLGISGKDANKFIFAKKEITRNLYEKIKNWDVVKEDIEPLFLKNKDISHLTESDLTGYEKELIQKIREKGIDPSKFKF